MNAWRRRRGGLASGGWALVVLMGPCAWGLCAWGPCACVPVTFSREAPIDFERYPSVLVTVTSSGDNVGDAAYLADQLRSVSGFALVSTDASASASLNLNVTVVADGGTTFNDDGTLSFEYRAEANFVASTPDGQVVDRGREVDTSQSFGESIEDVLDEVALHYFRPFRL